MAKTLIRWLKAIFLLCCFGTVFVSIRNSISNENVLQLLDCDSSDNVITCSINDTPFPVYCNCSCLEPNRKINTDNSYQCKCNDSRTQLTSCRREDGFWTCNSSSNNLMCQDNRLITDDNEDEAEQWCIKSGCEQWSEWSTCSTSCGGGLSQRSRRCPNFSNGLCSSEIMNDTAVCGVAPCPSWSLWSKWSSCSLTCSNGVNGTRTRTRACPKLEACGNGSFAEGDFCLPSVPCPTWTQWEPWRTCSRTCGRGDRERHRRCDFSNDTDSCLGSASQSEPCSNGLCPFNAPWSSWSPCTVTCGVGTKTRSRLTCARGPPTCPLENEEKKCNWQRCPQWSQWSNWMDCSRTCGGGQRIRTRVCPIKNGCVGQRMHLDKLRCNNFMCPTAATNVTSPPKP